MDRVIFKNPFLLGLLLLILILLATSPLHFAQGYTTIRMTTFLMYIVITVSWVIFSGPTGYMSLASAAFFGIGIYTSAVLFGKGEVLLPLPVVIAIGGAISFCFALLVGAVTLRLKGIYFAMFTFGLVELSKHLVLYYEFNVTGTRGRTVAPVDSDTAFYVMLTIFVVLMLTAYFIRRSRFGLALQSIGEDEEAAAHSGINVTQVKVVTFAISAFFMGAAGAIMATRWIYIDPYIAFNPLFSFMPVLMALVGGMGQLYGPVLGAFGFAYLQEFLITEYPYYYMLIFGFALVAVVVYLPNGLAGLVQNLTQRWRRWRKGGLAGQYANT